MLQQVRLLFNSDFMSKYRGQRKKRNWNTVQRLKSNGLQIGTRVKPINYSKITAGQIKVKYADLSGLPDAEALRIGLKRLSKK